MAMNARDRSMTKRWMEAVAAAAARQNLGTRVWGLDEASGVFAESVQCANVALEVQNHRNGYCAWHVFVSRWRLYYVTAVRCEAPLEQIAEWMRWRVAVLLRRFFCEWVGAVKEEFRGHACIHTVDC
jgi:hypothetical protein